MTRSTNSSESTSDPNRYLSIFRVAAGRTEYLRTLTHDYDGLLVHWCKGRAELCPGAAQCPIAIHRRVTWRGYAAAEVWQPRGGSWLPVCWEITERCEQDIRGVFKRGQVWRLHRAPEPDKRRQPVSASLVETLNERSLPNPFSIQSPLVAVYRVNPVVLGISNPLPGRQPIEATAGAPPKDLLPPTEQIDRRTIREIEAAAKAQGWVPGEPLPKV